MKSLALVDKFMSQRIMKQFAAKHHFVYFGAVDARNDDHELIRGITASTSHADSHYTVGTFQGHDVMLVERRNKLTFPGKADSSHRWLVLEFDLKRTGLPHIFINTRRHSDTFYANFRLGFAHLHDVTSLTVSLGKAGVYARTEALPVLHTLFSPDFVATLQSFNNFDYEISDGQVFVYAVSAPNPVVLTDMLRVGAWLANYLDMFQQEDPA